MTAATHIDSRVESLARQLRERGIENVDVACVLGSGLGGFAASLKSALRVPYSELEGLPKSTVPGHAGEFVFGELPGGARVLLQAGRVHLYEGHSAADVTLGVRTMVELGARVVLLTNAAGGLRKSLPPGTLMRMTDHVNRQGFTPLRVDQRGAAKVYDAAVGATIDAAAEAADVELAQGVYVALLGPSYESPSEVRFLGEFCGDAVGMSTALEALAAHAAGARVGGISCITNFAAGLSDTPPDHEEVLEVGRSAASRFQRLLAEALPKLAEL